MYFLSTKLFYLCSPRLNNVIVNIMKKISIAPNINNNPANTGSQWQTQSSSLDDPSLVDENQKISDNQALSEHTATQTENTYNTHQAGLTKQAVHTQIDMTKKPSKSLAVILLIAVLAGGATGWGAYRLRQQSGASSTDDGPAVVQRVAEGEIKNGDVFGMQDSDTFKDPAQGYLQDGGMNGEGSHRLLRVGGESQTVYLTSTVTDLDKLVGAEVKVWGETYSGQKVGWLMDVGKVEVIEVAGQPPFEEEL